MKREATTRVAFFFFPGVAALSGGAAEGWGESAATAALADTAEPPTGCAGDTATASTEDAATASAGFAITASELV
jgi:hypothetical protein